MKLHQTAIVFGQVISCRGPCGTSATRADGEENGLLSIVAPMRSELTNVRDFPVPRRHRCARIGLRYQSFQEGKSHEHSFYGWNRLGKKCVFSPWRRCRWNRHDPSDGLESETCATDCPAAAVLNRHGSVFGSSRVGASIRHLWPQRKTDGTQICGPVSQGREERRQ